MKYCDSPKGFKCCIILCGKMESGKSSTINNILSALSSFSRPVLCTMGNSDGKNRYMVEGSHWSSEKYANQKRNKEKLEDILCGKMPKQQSHMEYSCVIVMHETVGSDESTLFDSIDHILSVLGFPKPVEDGGLFSASDAKIAAGMQKMRVLKQNGLLEEELNWQDISFIADNLYMGGHLNHLQLKQIQDKSQPRRKAVDSLIDAIIGNPSAVSAFIRILESESRFSYIAEKIASTHIAAAELERVLTQDHLFQSWKTNQILNNKRKYLSFACEYPAAQKRMKMQESDSEAVKEKKMVKSLQIAIVGQKLWSQVGKHLGLEFKEAYKGPFEDEE